jgi:alginate O-acetyltransferase complex protein AlgI
MPPDLTTEKGSRRMGAETRGWVAPRPERALHRQYLPVQQAPSGSDRPTDSESGLYRGEPETCRRSLRPFLRNFIYLVLLLAVFKVYRIEERAFQGRAFQVLVTIAILALPFHYVAPFRWKKPVFLAASIVGLFWVFGSFVTAIVLGIATVLIAICFLRIAWIGRVAILSVLALGLAWARSTSARTSIPENVWPVITSIFMFRLIIYLYELKHVKKPESLLDTLSYFLLLPNFCFMHFPVVDYRTMQRGYFADNVHAVQRRGLQMMFRGTIHLLCYRLVYHELLFAPSKVHDLVSLGAYLVCNYLLYLQVSGQFHMACGMLHLFGFQLPETHHRYLLATGFTDYWRRINIYWKDFMIRIFFNPVVFRLKKWPRPAALATATAIVFVATWLLHAYQSFWLRGSCGFTVPDALFWGLLGALVLVNVQLDARRSGSRERWDSSASGWSALIVRAVKVGGTFTTVTLLWSLWSSPSISAWIDLLRRGFYGS